MPQFSDDLFLGSAQTYMGVNTNSALGDPSSMDLGVGPVGRIYVWDTVPAAKAANNLVTSTTPTVAGSLTITAGAGVTAVTLSNGSTAYQLDVPRAVSVATASGTHASANLTVSGYDYYGQAMSEVIASSASASTTVNGNATFNDEVTISTGKILHVDKIIATNANSLTIDDNLTISTGKQLVCSDMTSTDIISTDTFGSNVADSITIVDNVIIGSAAFGNKTLTVLATSRFNDNINLASGKTISSGGVPLASSATAYTR